MRRITLRVPEELADTIEKFADENQKITSKQHAYRYFLQRGFDEEMNAKDDRYKELLEIVASLSIESRQCIQQIYRNNFDAKKSKFETPEDEFEATRVKAKKLVNDVIGKG